MVFIVIFVPVSIVAILILVNFIRLNRIRKKYKNRDSDEKDT